MHSISKNGKFARQNLSIFFPTKRFLLKKATLANKFTSNEYISLPNSPMLAKFFDYLPQNLYLPIAFMNQLNGVRELGRAGVHGMPVIFNKRFQFQFTLLNSLLRQWNHLFSFLQDFKLLANVMRVLV